MDTNSLSLGCWADVEAVLGGAGAIDALAVETGALKRRRAVADGSQLLGLAMGYAATGRSLRSTAAWSATALDMALCDVSLLGRLREAGGLPVGGGGAVAGLVVRLRRALAAVERAAGPAGGRQPVRRRRRDGGQHRLHASYDPALRRFNVLDLTPVQEGERLDRARIEPGLAAGWMGGHAV